MPEMEIGRVDRPVGLPVGSTGRSGYRSGRVSLTGWSSRLKHRSNSPFLQLKDILVPIEI